MAAKKEISGFIKLQINGGQANPAPPVGPALGQRGVNIMEFCKAFNDKTKSMAGKPVPVEITVYKDKKFDFKIKSPPASYYIKEAVKLKGGSKEPGRNIVASISKKQLEDIAKEKMAKKIEGYIKLNIPAGAANPSPPVGPALGQRGVNIMEFCKAFNASTESLEKNMPIPVVITVFSDKSFSFITKTPPVSFYLKKAAGKDKGSSEPGRVLGGSVKINQVREIAENKMKQGEF